MQNINRDFNNSQNKKPLISIVCPVFNEQYTIPIFYDRLERVLEIIIDKFNIEIIFVNNRSIDKTLEVLLELQKNDLRIHIFTLSRNFGYQGSLQAAMTYISGDAMIVIDADCEDPPELILEFLSKWQEGYDIVYGMRVQRNEPWWYEACCNLYYRLLRKCGDMDIVLYMAEFALVSSHIIASLINARNSFPFVRAEIGYAGFSKYGIPYKREPRSYGKTNYNFYQKIAFGIGGVLTSSTFLFRLAGYSLPIVLIINLYMIISLILINTNSIINTCIIINLSYIVYLLTIIGIYLARVYKNSLQRPNFIIDPRYTFTNKFGNKYFQKNSNIHL